MHLSEILETELAALRERAGHDDLHVVETGTIRATGDEYRENDGWSTLTFAREIATHGGSLTAIDLDPSAAQEILTREGLLTERVTLIQRDSVGALASEVQLIASGCRGGAGLDVAFLDSANDADLILAEYKLVGPLMAHPGLIMVDDVDLDSTGVVKGHAIVPHLDEQGVAYRIVRRSGDGYSTGVLIIEV